MRTEYVNIDGEWHKIHSKTRASDLAGRNFYHVAYSKGKNLHYATVRDRDIIFKKKWWQFWM